MAKYAHENGAKFCKFIDAFGQTRWIGLCIFRMARMTARSAILLSLPRGRPPAPISFIV
jgi:hypothetical protein